MTSSPANPWVERFIPLFNRDEIRNRVAVEPGLLTDYERLSPVQAKEKFSKRLKEMFYPSTQCIEILYEWIQFAFEHCQSHYHGRREFSAKVYEEKVSFPDFSVPICLTGPAGVGKSHLLKALGRLLPSDGIVTGEDNTEFRLESYRLLTIQANSSAQDILAELVGQKAGAGELAKIARKRAYQCGWALLGVDEFQFLTQSEKANTRIAQLLMLVAYVGIPVIYAANFSMLHKLLRRNQEDRQRLLCSFAGLLPEQPNSRDWVGLLQWHKRIAPDAFEFDAENDAEAIHQLTGGINRAEKKLLEIAFLRAMKTGRAIGLRELEAAYKFRDYAVYRTDIEILAKLPFSAALQKARKDLWCPFDITPRLASEETFSERRQERVGDAAIEASLNAAERGALTAITTRSSSRQKQNAPKIVSIDKQRSLAERLREDAAWFEEKY